MRLIRDHDQQGVCDASAVTIGNFDGLHIGHQALLERARSLADEKESSCAFLSFEPLAAEYFQPRPPARIYNASERLRLLACSGQFDIAWLLRFNADLASMSAERFVDQILVAGLNARDVVVGADFRFGQNRQGDVTQLKDLGSRLGFDVHVVDTVERDGLKVSSTAIRQALDEGNFDAAAAMLGRPYRMYGRVVRGKQLGRELGYPTANIRLHRQVSPLNGIHAVRVWCPESGLENHPGVASLGTRPTIDGDDEALLEVHLFDFDGDLYGKHLDTQFVKFLRSEEKFDGLDALVTQMDIDSQRARKALDKA